MITADNWAAFYATKSSSDNGVCLTDCMNRKSHEERMTSRVWDGEGREEGLTMECESVQECVRMSMWTREASVVGEDW